ncbi:MAG: hypothetical protein SFZ03_02365 [Candidatus Melainabacteria bacterium]|nr:hypothetical protein [Candidatus Melainabacteria bacterium]
MNARIFPLLALCLLGLGGLWPAELVAPIALAEPTGSPRETYPYRVPAADPMHPNATEYVVLGQTRMHEERYLEAIEYFKLAIGLNPSSAVTAAIYNNLGDAYLALGQAYQQYGDTRNAAVYFQYAIISFQYAIRIQPQFAAYFQNLARTYRLAGYLSLAEGHLLDALAHNPADAEACFLLALIYGEQNQAQLAQQRLQQFLALAPHTQLAVAAKRLMNQPKRPRRP